MGKKSGPGAKGGKKPGLGDVKAAKKRENRQEALQENEQAVKRCKCLQEGK